MTTKSLNKYVLQNLDSLHKHNIELFFKIGNVNYLPFSDIPVSGRSRWRHANDVINYVTALLSVDWIFSVLEPRNASDAMCIWIVRIQK